MRYSKHANVERIFLFCYPVFVRVKRNTNIGEDFSDTDPC